jgi:uncharacterized protein (TIGR02246 family)
LEDPDVDLKHNPGTARDAVPDDHPEQPIESRFFKPPEETMKIHLFALVGLAIGLAMPTFAQQKDTVDPLIAEQIRVLASNFDAAFNNNDAAAVTALYTEDGVWKTPHGIFTGRQAIEKDYDYEFGKYHTNNLSTKLDRVDSVGNDVSAMGTWSCTFQDDFGHTKHVKGQVTWVLVHEAILGRSARIPTINPSLIRGNRLESKPLRSNDDRNVFRLPQLKSKISEVAAGKRSHSSNLGV